MRGCVLSEEEIVGYMARLKHCLDSSCGWGLQRKLCGSVANPFQGEGPWSFPIWEGTIVTREEEEELRKKNILLRRDEVVEAEKDKPRLLETKFRVQKSGEWEFRHRGRRPSGVDTQYGKQGGQGGGSKQSGGKKDAGDTTKPESRYGKKLRYVKTPTEKMKEQALKGVNTPLEVLSETRLDGGWVFRVKSGGVDSGGEYEITLCQESTCTCPWFVNAKVEHERWMHCKHIYAMLLKGFGLAINGVMVHQPAYSKGEVKEIVRRGCNFGALGKVLD